MVFLVVYWQMWSAFVILVGFVFDLMDKILMYSWSNFGWFAIAEKVDL